MKQSVFIWLLLLCNSSFCQDPNTSLTVPFNEGFYGCEGAPNPFPVVANMSLIDNGRHGKALHFEPHVYPRPPHMRETIYKNPLIIFDGNNIPDQKGTVSFYFRSPADTNCWSDGKRYWIAVIVPEIYPKYAKPVTGLALVKQEDNKLALWVYQIDEKRRLNHFRDGVNIAKPSTVPVSISTKELKKDDWVLCRFSWDMEKQKVWLGVNDKIVSGTCTLSPQTKALAFAMGSPPSQYHDNPLDIGIHGDLDELVIDKRTLDNPEIGVQLPEKLPPMAIPEKLQFAEKILVKKDPWSKKVELQTRSHLRRVIDSQTHGGWNYYVGYPSLINFRSNMNIMPCSKSRIAISKERNSAKAALWLALAYEVLGEKEYLEAAERTAEMLMKIQHTDGWWPYGARFFDGKYITSLIAHRPYEIPFEDHVQSYPVLLLLYLHSLTGKQKYLDSAEKGIQFILKGQNPNGSWSHNYDYKKGCGTTKGYDRGGSVNDYSTTDQMAIMLIAYRLTGNQKFLRSYLRGADWLVDSFIDQKGKGWAQQYDEHNNPVWARHFEPPSVCPVGEGSLAVPQALMDAYILTGKTKYIEPVRKWIKWLKENIKDGGWYNDYDCKTGKPIYAHRRKIIFIDGTEKIKTRNKGIGEVMSRFNNIESEKKKVEENAKITKKQIQTEYGKHSDTLKKWADIFKPEIGTVFWFDCTPHGPCFEPSTSVISYFLRRVFLARLTEEQVPLTHRLAGYTMSDWSSPLTLILKKEDLVQPLSTEQLMVIEQEKKKK